MTLEENIQFVRAMYPDAIAIKGISRYAIITISQRTLEEIENYKHTELTSQTYEISRWVKTIDEAWNDSAYCLNKRLEDKLAY